MQIPTYDMQLSLENAEDDAKQLVRKIRPEWSTLKTKKFDQGRTNVIIGVSCDRDGKTDMILVRIYGKGTELLIDREKELQTVQRLAEHGLTGVLYAKFTNGYAHEFLPGTELTTETVRDAHIAPLIAKAMAVQHALVSLTDSDRRGGSILFKKMRDFLTHFPTSFEDKQANEILQRDIPTAGEILKEIDNLDEHIRRLHPPLVLCHNDLLLNNVLYDKQNDKIYFIDMEYAAVNYQAYDIGNHFAEYCGFDNIDFGLYPTREYQLRWLRNYLQHYYENAGQQHGVALATDLDVERLYVQVQKFALASHLFWAIWAVLQEKHSSIEFGFLNYGRKKFGEFKARRHEFLALKMPEDDENYKLEAATKNASGQNKSKSPVPANNGVKNGDGGGDVTTHA